MKTLQIQFNVLLGLLILGDLISGKKGGKIEQLSILPFNVESLLSFGTTTERAAM